MNLIDIRPLSLIEQESKFIVTNFDKLSPIWTNALDFLIVSYFFRSFLVLKLMYFYLSVSLTHCFKFNISILLQAKHSFLFINS